MLTFSQALTADSELTLEEYALKGSYLTDYDDRTFTRFYDDYLYGLATHGLSHPMEIRKFDSFRSLLYLLARDISNLINYSRLARELDLSFATVKNWVNILEGSFIITTLQPFHTNTRKTLTKTPKVYFNDTGLLVYLLGIRSLRDMLLSPQFGAIMENLIVVETAKHYQHQGVTPELYFYRDDSKAEIDLLDFTNTPRAIEVKSGMTYRHAFARHLTAIAPELGISPENRFLLFRENFSQKFDDYWLLPAQKYLTYFNP